MPFKYFNYNYDSTNIYTGKNNNHMAKELIDVISDTSSILELISNPLFHYSDVISHLNPRDKSDFILNDAEFAVMSGAFDSEEDYLSSQYKISSPLDVCDEHVASLFSKTLFDFTEGSDNLGTIGKTVAALDKKLRDPKNCAHLMSRMSFKEKYSSLCLKQAEEVHSELRHYNRSTEWSFDEIEQINMFNRHLEMHFSGLLLKDMDGLKVISSMADIEGRHPLYPTEYQLITSTSQYQKILEPIDQIILDSTQNPSLIFNLLPRDFEKYLAQIWGDFGFEVELTAQTRDGGADLLCVSNKMGVPLKIAIEVKRYASDRPISVELVRSFIGANAALNANKLVYVTSSRYTKDARELAMSPSITNLIDLYELPDVIRWANAYVEKNGF